MVTKFDTLSAKPSAWAIPARFRAAIVWVRWFTLRPVLKRMKTPLLLAYFTRRSVTATGLPVS